MTDINKGDDLCNAQDANNADNGLKNNTNCHGNPYSEPSLLLQIVQQNQQLMQTVQAQLKQNTMLIKQNTALIEQIDKLENVLIITQENIQDMIAGGDNDNEQQYESFDGK